MGDEGRGLTEQAVPCGQMSLPRPQEVTGGGGGDTAALQFQVFPLSRLVSLEVGTPELNKGYRGSAGDMGPLVGATEGVQRGLLGSTAGLASCAKLA